MSAVVDIVLADFKDVLKIPVAAIVSTGTDAFCWVKKGSDVKQRKIELGDTNDEFTIVKAGLQGGEDVVLNPTAFLDEAQKEALKPSKNEPEQESVESPVAKSIPGEASPEKEKPKPKKQPSTSVGAQVVAAGDKNGDGVLTEDEFEEKDRENFSKVDTNGDNKVTSAEIDVAIKAASGE